VDLGEFPNVQNRTAVDGVDSHLRFAIQNGVYVSGQRLPTERELTEALGVARPTLRLALGRLKVEGYLETKLGASAGTFVTDLVVPVRRWLERMKNSPAELLDIHDYNLMLETTAAGFAAERRTDRDVENMSLALDEMRVLTEIHRLGRRPDSGEHAFLRGADTRFHQAVASASGCRRLAAAIFIGRGELFTAALLEAYDDTLTDQMHTEHASILEAIRAGDSVAARSEMAAHCESAYRRLTGLLHSVTEASGRSTNVSVIQDDC
jgi:GntR family transcriptional regulator, transcriptional repressor for pyruvate dehydrogenase complex